MKLKDICCACLSLERKLSPLSTKDGVNNLFVLLTNNSDTHQVMSNKDTTHFYICWECSAVLRRLCSFKQQVCDAQQQLVELLDDTHDINKNTECLSKLSYNFKRSFDKELVFSDVLKDDNIEDETRIDIKSDDSEQYIKTEIDNTENDRDSETNPFSDINYGSVDNIKEENGNAKNDFVMKPEVKIQYDNGGVTFVTVEIPKAETEESKPKKRVLKRKVNDGKDTPKGKGGAKNRNSVKKVKKDFEEENKNVSQEVQKVPTAPKTRRPRKVQNKPLENPTLDTPRSTENTTYPCADCEQVFTNYTSRYEHILKCHKEGYQCATCGKKFHIKKSFLRHERVHIAKTLPPEKCDICGAMVRCDLVKDHAHRHARKDTGTHECVPCRKRFANINTYRKHMTEAQAHLPNVQKKFECETCQKSFRTQLLYKCHMRYTKIHAVAAAIYRYKCSMCEKSYRSRSALRDHVNYVHMGKTQHKCTVCEKALASPQCVARHMKLFHGGYKCPKNKLCVTCGKAFASKKELREHELVHTGERPLKCDVCGDTFRQSGALYTHKRRVHKVPLKPSVELVTETDEAVEKLLRGCELSETELVISRVVNAKTH
ncbi:zinc finger protein 69-like [Maniola jurtina]|uniref:zinc finger protein 69-like n=1 Tax=Maniola jurtina TaxID=191418 RepID=UPI001E68C638|nr:zinc finger protein 69-like [Maniola jurtina]